MILFLDFDGVLHPEFSHESRHFCCLPVLEQVVRQLQDCEVVISSTWRVLIFHWTVCERSFHLTWRQELLVRRLGSVTSRVFPTH